MPLSTDINMYNDVRQRADQAILSDKGIRVSMPNKGQAVYFRQRFYKFRLLERQASLDIHAEGTSEYGIGTYDNLSANIMQEGDDYFVEIVKMPEQEVQEL